MAAAHFSSCFLMIILRDIDNMSKIYNINIAHAPIRFLSMCQEVHAHRSLRTSAFVSQSK